jgi:Kef-type K+ transport system membrane component KefB
MLESPFLQMAAILVVAAIVGMLALALRQPLIVAFIGVGVLVGPASLGWVEGGTELELLASLGIGILLFLVGLKLDPQLIRTTGPVALATGLGQVAFTSLVGFGIGIALGLGMQEAAYVAVALTFSSTIIIVKLLSDKRELDDLHGRIAVGFLIVQDIVVVIALIVITALGEAGSDDVATRLILTLSRGAAS